MTVYREQQHEVQAPISTVVEAVQAALKQRANGYAYDQVHYDQSQQHFTARIRPQLYPLMLSTPLTISLQPKGPVTVVRVQTRSQRWIWGDIFNLYNRYIDEFITQVAANVR